MENDSITSAAYLRDKGLLFSTPYTIDFETQKKIIDYTMTNGHDLQPEEGDPFWTGIGLTTVTQTPDFVDSINIGWWYYLIRMDESYNWAWKNCEITPLVKKVLEPMAPFFKKFTRITVVLQKKGVHLPAHRDLVPGDFYKSMLNKYNTFTGDKYMRYVGTPWFAEHYPELPSNRHMKQRFLNLKIPLSEVPNNPGSPFIVNEGNKIRYSSENKLFFLNEAEIEHGADPVDYIRGVVFVDGILNMDTWSNLITSDINVLT